VERPERTYPLALLLTVSVVALTYVLPILAVSRSGIPASEWSTGSWANVARTLAGPSLETGMVVGGMLSAFGMLNALILSYTRLPPVLAEDGFLPKVLARRHPETGAPQVSIVACAVVWALALNIGFERLIALDLLFYGLSLILEFIALVVLRVREPGLPRPYRVPGGIAGALLVGVAPAGLILVALVQNAHDSVGPMNALVFGAILVLSGFAIYGISRLVAKRAS
jgi:amino acid transporter